MKLGTYCTAVSNFCITFHKNGVALLSAPQVEGSPAAGISLQAQQAPSGRGKQEGPKAAVFFELGLR